MRITDLLDKNSISLNAAPADKKETLDLAVELMAKSGKLSDVEKYREQVYAREEESTTGIGEGIAIPHGKCDAVKAPGLAAMVIKNGVEYESLDGEPVTLLFLIAAPNTKDNVHLDVLSKLSVMLMDENFTTSLRNAKSVDEFLQIIDAADESAKSIDDRLSDTGITTEKKKGFKLLAVTSCPTGIAHTYMAAEALEKAARAADCQIKIETRGSAGAKNVLTAEEIEAADTQLVGQLKQRFSQRYPYQVDVLRKNKYSVSELKHRAMREKFEAEQEETIPAFLEEPVTPTIPLFIQREESVEQETANRGALRGTAVHRVMECYDFASEKSVHEQMEAMEKEEKITADMRALVREQTVADFVSSETGKRMALAQRGGALYREKPFVMGFTEEELERYGFGAGAQMIENEAQTENAQQEIMSENVSQENHMHEEDLTLIQGIIDVFWIEDDGITVLDYKTDRVDTAQELIDRYATQLKLYADALERVFATRKLKVKEILIYSFRLVKLISIE